MSARDMARVGQLYLQNGMWNGQQIVSEDWINESTSVYSDHVQGDGVGYAYMIWTEKMMDSIYNYSARGVGNQAIVVFPQLDIVMVNRANTFKGERVDSKDLNRLMEMIINAKSGEEARLQSARPLEILNEYDDSIEISIADKVRLMGCYDTVDGQVMITMDHGKLVANFDNSDRFHLIPIAKNEFLLEDAEIKVRFEVDENGRGIGLQPISE